LRGFEKIFEDFSGASVPAPIDPRHPWSPLIEFAGICPVSRGVTMPRTSAQEALLGRATVCGVAGGHRATQDMGQRAAGASDREPTRLVPALVAGQVH